MSNLKHYRQKAKLTQAELAELVGLSSGVAISNYEAGRRTPDIHTLMAIRDALRGKKVRVNLEDLVDEKRGTSAA